MPSLRIRTGDFDCFYEDDYFGPAWVNPEVIVLQHGYSRNVEHWRGWVPHLSSRFRVIRRDARGHGGSSSGTPHHTWSLESFAADVIEFLDALGLQRVHFVGEMTGGSTGLILAARAPERLQSLTLVQSPLDLVRAAKVILASNADEEKAAGCESSVMRARSSWEQQQRARCDPIALAAIAASFPSTDLGQYLEHVRVSTLLCSPVNHPAMPLEGQLEMRRRIRNARLEAYDGDIVVHDLSERLSQAVLSFVGSLDVRGKCG